jgi:hypothetical protein
MFNDRDKYDHLEGYAPTPAMQGFGVKLGFERPEGGGPQVKQERANYETMPTLAEVTEQVHSLEQGLNREIWKMPATSIKMDPATGRIGTKDGIHATIDAVRQIMNMQGARGGQETPAGASTYVSTIPDLDWRAQEFNRIVQTGGDKPIQVFTWTNGPDRQIYAIASERYTPYPPNMLLDKLLQEEGLSAQKAQVLYSPIRATVRLVSDAEVNAEELMAGEIFRMVKCFQSSEDMTSAISSWEELWRSLCTNLSIIRKDRSNKRSRKHTGSLDDIHAAVARMGNGGVTDLNKHLDACRTAQKVVIPAEMLPPVVSKVTAADKTTKAKALLQAPGVRGVDLMTEILRYAEEEKQEGHNLYTLHNGVTRAAHKGSWPNSQVTDALQRGATDLLHEPVLVSAVLDELNKTNRN